MTHQEFDRTEHADQRSVPSRIIDWLGGQGPAKLTIYMCGAVTLFAYIADAIR